VPIIPDPRRIKAFRTQQAFEAWLSKHHDRWPELWLRIYKKGSGVATVTYPQALDVALCWGWIDGLKKSFDGQSFLQRFTPRGAKSVWSQVNQGHVARLTQAKRMTPHGQRHVDAAKADGRWAAAYAPIRSASAESVPADLRAAIDANPRAKAAFPALTRMELFGISYRTNAMKTPEGRARKIAELVDALATRRAPARQPARRVRKR
jgi:uncharacterized protein YdeI (YjbR/CyaY-like superfamily)